MIDFPGSSPQPDPLVRSFFSVEPNRYQPCTNQSFSSSSRHQLLLSLIALPSFSAAKSFRSFHVRRRVKKTAARCASLSPTHAVPTDLVVAPLAVIAVSARTGSTAAARTEGPVLALAEHPLPPAAPLPPLRRSQSRLPHRFLSRPTRHHRSHILRLFRPISLPRTLLSRRRRRCSLELPIAIFGPSRRSTCWHSSWHSSPHE